MEQTLHADILSSFPAVNEAAVDALLRSEIAASSTKFIVLDDDPTGVQTVHDVSVYTDWSVESMESGLREEGKLFYILTNSRGLTAAETTAVHEEIAANIAAAAKATGQSYLIMSRSDSTLRGHFPLETELLRQGMERAGRRVDGEILCPFFKEGGRFTIGNTHYVRYGDELIPAAQTEFAKDRTFGYTHSDLPGYIEEKTGGRFSGQDVVCISLQELRRQDYDGIAAKLEQVKNFNKVCVNAVDYCDVKVFAVALYRAMARGKTFLFRTAAGLVKVVGGISDIPLLRREDMVKSPTRTGGVVVVGSHTQKTTAQLEALLALPCVEAIAFRSSLVLEGDAALNGEVSRCLALEEAAIRAGKVAVCFTERTLLNVDNDTPESALLRSVKISDAVQKLVGQLQVTPAFIVAKGGITSSTVGTQALHVKKANVLGQICPGIPVWQTDEASKFPQIPYVIFPGNVGGVETLRQAVEILTQA
ncbi:four-carbon acid sugar kinase family protein [Oscillibacter sp.]|uniref:four-carbon acid sugar kinase family protein n=1 Tax=Oscillibacter sp. TaxID=1945593 RepID=UPI002631A2F4|nr:four-carbon acid sugar kinase family protein [Oscillibacter sp.]MDD3346140.1 four-carbon acid sugar kinase family protein [Oscillibacter sp.]